MWTRILLVSLPIAVAPGALQAEEPVDLEAVHRIKDEAFNRSQVMDYLFHLTDVNGHRLAGSPGYRKAAEWAARTLKEAGTEGPGLEVWGSEHRGWSFTRASVQMKEPVKSSIPAIPQAWSAGTDGVTATVVMAPLFEKHGDPDLYDLPKLSSRIDGYIKEHTGKLKGKIVLIDPLRDIDLAVKPEGSRHDAESLAALSSGIEPKQRDPIERPITSVPADPVEQLEFYNELNPFLADDYWIRERELYERLHAFLSDEGAAAVLMVNTIGGGGIIFTDYRVSWIPGAPVPPPTLMLEPEGYNRLVRLVEKDVNVVLEVAVDAELIDEAVEGVNVVAEIPGGSKRKEVVMLGGHLDSWHAATGATDNAAGCATPFKTGKGGSGPGVTWGSIVSMASLL